MSSTNAVNETVRALIKACGDTPAEVAVAMGHSVGWLNSKLSRRVGWSVRDLDEVAARYGVTVIDLFRGPDHIVTKLEKSWQSLPEGLRPGVRDSRAPRQRTAPAQLELEGAA